uniref:uncharacterized protein n=1 Tax=Centroberyx gerrardi TaxID=166262 RepID=UPI003AB06EA8
MSAPLLLRAFVNERLTAAAEEIFGVFEKTISKYEEEVSSSQQEIERLRRLLLDFGSNQKTDPPQPPVCKEETPPEERSQWDPEPLHVKEEDQESWTSRQEEPVQEFEEADVLYLPLSSTWVKHERDPSPSLQPQIQNAESGERLQELQGAKIMQFTLPRLASTPSSQPQIQSDESVPDGSESKRPVASFNKLKSNNTLTGKTQMSLIASGKSAAPDHHCYLCQKSFAYMQHLINHVQRIHSKDAGALCGVCGKNLESADSLNAHLKTHKGSRFCRVCGKLCTGSTALTEHMASHAGVKLHRCHVCGKECSRKGDLKIHMRIHTGEKPFCCSFCCRSFTHSGHLRKHMRSHTGERPHQCEVCGRGFLQSTHLKCHLRTHAEKY